MSQDPENLTPLENIEVIKNSFELKKLQKENLKLDLEIAELKKNKINKINVVQMIATFLAPLLAAYLLLNSGFFDNKTTELRGERRNLEADIKDFKVQKNQDSLKQKIQQENLDSIGKVLNNTNDSLSRLKRNIDQLTLILSDKGKELTNRDQTIGNLVKENQRLQGEIVSKVAFYKDSLAKQYNKLIHIGGMEMAKINSNVWEMWNLIQQTRGLKNEIPYPRN